MTDDTKEEESFFDLSDEFGSSEKASVEGVWIQLGEKARILVARLANPAAQKAYKKIPKAVRKLHESGNTSNKQMTEFLCRFLASQILKDWEDMFDKGKALPAYTEEHGFAFLTKYRRFRDRVWELADDEDLFNVEVEEAVGNSPKRSGGT